MKYNSLQYLTKEGLQNIRTNRLMSLASIGVLTSCLVMMGCAIMLSININALVSKLEEENVIVVFAEVDAAQEEVTKIGEQLEQVSNLKKVEFLPKEEAWTQQLGQLDDAKVQSFLDEQGENPLPDGYKVTVDDMKQFAETEAALERMEGVSSVRANGDIAKRMQSLRQSITILGLIVIGILLLVALFIISNTIRLTMYARRLEINIMKSVGATDSFIKWPFMIEGLVLGGIAGIISLLVVYLLYTPIISNFLSVIPLMGEAVRFSKVAPWMLLGFLLIGAGSGVAGSLLSIRKYLKYEGSEISEP